MLIVVRASAAETACKADVIGTGSSRGGLDAAAGQDLVQLALGDEELGHDAAGVLEQRSSDGLVTGRAVGGVVVNGSDTACNGGPLALQQRAASPLPTS